MLEELLKNVRPATKEELRQQGENLAKNYKPGPRQATPFIPIAEPTLCAADDNPRIADCSYCGYTIWAKQGYMQEDGDTCHIQCKLIRATEKSTLTLCTKAMCEMCEQELELKELKELKLAKNKRYWHFVSGSGWVPCKASPIWEKVKK